MNEYYRQITEEGFETNEHREFVGGLWHEIGKLQFEFLKSQGIQPTHKLLDIGCGCLRGGIHFVDYLIDGHYTGIDCNSSVLRGGIIELRKAGLGERRFTLKVCDQFQFNILNTWFDYALAQSLFTHLYANQIEQCIYNLSQVLKPGGVFCCSLFIVDNDKKFKEILHEPCGIKSFSHKDPFHYTISDIYRWANEFSFQVDWIGDWRHPRNQKMVVLSKI